MRHNMNLNEAVQELKEHGYIIEGMSPTYVKGKRNMYSKMNDRDLVVAFYAHWIGYDSDGMKSGTSNNPTCEKIDNMLYKRLGLVWDEACNVLNAEVTKITEEAWPIKGKPRYIDIMKQAKEAWPHVVIYLVDNMSKVFRDAREKIKANEEEYKSRGYTDEFIWGEDVKGKLE